MEPCHRAEQYQIGTNSSHKFLFTFHWILLCTVLGPVACWQPLMTCFSTLITASKNWSHHQQNSTVDAHLWIGFILLMLCWHDFFGWVSGADLTSRHRFTAVHMCILPLCPWKRFGLILQSSKYRKCKLFHTSIFAAPCWIGILHFNSLSTTNLFFKHH